MAPRPRPPSIAASSPSSLLPLHAKATPPTLPPSRHASCAASSPARGSRFRLSRTPSSRSSPSSSPPGKRDLESPPAFFTETPSLRLFSLQSYPTHSFSCNVIHRGCNASCSCTSIAALSCEVLGAAALKSMEAGETLASDSGITNGLARALRSRSRRVVEAACNAVMDLSASSVGRERLAGSLVLLRIL
jgi:hypothetical protein